MPLVLLCIPYIHMHCHFKNQQIHRELHIMKYINHGTFFYFRLQTETKMCWSFIRFLWYHSTTIHSLCCCGSTRRPTSRAKGLTTENSWVHYPILNKCVSVLRCKSFWKKVSTKWRCNEQVGLTGLKTVALLKLPVFPVHLTVTLQYLFEWGPLAWLIVLSVVQS